MRFLTWALAFCTFITIIVAMLLLSLKIAEIIGFVRNQSGPGPSKLLGDR